MSVRRRNPWAQANYNARYLRAYDKPLKLVGNTPLCRLEKVPAKHGIKDGVKIYAKLEFFNPGGSVKDRAALNIILSAIRDGNLTPDKTILDATSGNTGVSYSMISAALGYKCKMLVPANANAKKVAIMKAYGAEVVFTDPVDGIDGAIKKAREIYEQDPRAYFYANQYDNDANWLAHYRTTGPEIIRQTRGRLTHFIAGVGTSGTFMGVGRRLKEFNPSIKLVEVQPDSGFHGIEGLKHMGTSIRPKIYDENFSDVRMSVSTIEAYEMVKELAKVEGVLVGISSGAALSAALKIAKELGRGLLVVIFPDGGEKYLEERFWREELQAQPL
ncbi:MAG: cysteine synthase family protein [Nitrososphaerota archaeon]